MHRFFVDDLVEGFNTLKEEESGHAIRVLRLQKGDTILLVNGKGKKAVASISDAHPKKCKLELLGNIDFELPQKTSLNIAIAPTKSIERFEWFIEKAVEIGISEITPILSKKSERKILNPLRLQKVILSAMKQSQRLYLPTLNEFCSFERFIQLQQKHSQKFVAHCGQGSRELFSEVLNKEESCTILIGPEGDFSEDEILLAFQNNYVPISFGNARLRTETAGVYATSIYNS